MALLKDLKYEHRAYGSWLNRYYAIKYYASSNENICVFNWITPYLWS